MNEFTSQRSARTVGKQESSVADWKRRGAWLGWSQAGAGVLAFALFVSRTSWLPLLTLSAAAWTTAIGARALRAPDPRLPATLKRAIFVRRLIWRVAAVVFFVFTELVAVGSWMYDQWIQMKSPSDDAAQELWHQRSDLLTLLALLALGGAVILWLVGLLVGIGGMQARADRIAVRKEKKLQELREAAKRYGRPVSIYSAGNRKRRSPAKPVKRAERVSVQIGGGTITFDGEAFQAASGSSEESITWPLATSSDQKPGPQDPAGPVASITAFHEQYTINYHKGSYAVNKYQVALQDEAGRRVLVCNTAPLSEVDHQRLGELAKAASIQYTYYDFGETGSTTPHRYQAHFPLAPGAYELAPRKMKSAAGAMWIGGAIVAVAGLLTALIVGLGNKNLVIGLLGLAIFVGATAIAWVGMLRVPVGPPQPLKGEI
ncbi:MAG: hypothetical protein J2P36_11095 [Ktedonobacteraceae bacterium]|nr:hypothetical protein [Ktedonobacteraceae bacterium]